MSFYSISLFLHIVGALGLFAALSLEWTGLLGLRRATTAGQARQWMRLMAVPRTIAGPSALIVLLAGIYLSIARWGVQAWIVVGLTTMVFIAVLGPALGGRRWAAIARSLPPGEEGSLGAAFGQRVRDAVLSLSISLRVALFVGIVFLMSTKPGIAGALAAIGVAALLGLAPALSNRTPAAKLSQESH